MVARYGKNPPASDLTIWRFGCKATRIDRGQRLRVEVLAPARVRWSTDGWATVRDVETVATSFHVHVAVLDTSGLRAGDRVLFTLFWPDADRWEGVDFTVEVIEPAGHDW